MTTPLRIKIGDVISISEWAGKTDAKWCGHLYKVVGLNKEGFVIVKVLFDTIYCSSSVLHFHISNTRFVIP